MSANRSILGVLAGVMVLLLSTIDKCDECDAAFD